jgi:hypothetical protein
LLLRRIGIELYEKYPVYLDRSVRSYALKLVHPSTILMESLDCMAGCVSNKLKHEILYLQTMLGFYWALFAERATGLTVREQVFSPGASGLTFFILAVLVFAYASLIPIMNGESTDARSWGPFNARAERWNGRLAMIGFAALIIDEMFRGSPVFPMY